MQGTWGPDGKSAPLRSGLRVLLRASKWYGRPMVRCILMALLFAALLVTAWAEDRQEVTPAEALENARSLVAANRYTEALAVLEPMVGDNLGDPTSWEIAAETGRAAFHLGQYHKAHEIFQRVVPARPVVLEPALYLQATSYLLGDHRQALAIFEAVLKSPIQDLYLAVTLPGEKQFLAEPEVQKLLRQYAKPLTLRPDSATAHGVQLGQGMSEISAKLDIGASDAGSTLIARAGPYLIWIFSFDGSRQLEEIVLNADHLSRYTPFGLDLADGISWTSTPIECIESLGGADRTSAAADGALIMTWDFSKASLDLVFSRPDADHHGAAVLEMIRMYRRHTRGR